MLQFITASPRKAFLLWSVWFLQQSPGVEIGNCVFVFFKIFLQCVVWALQEHIIHTCPLFSISRALIIIIIIIKPITSDFAYAALILFDTKIRILHSCLNYNFILDFCWSHNMCEGHRLGDLEDFCWTHASSALQRLWPTFYSLYFRQAHTQPLTKGQESRG